MLQRNNIITKYNQLYKTRASAFGNNPYPFVKKISKLLNGGIILDAGCGDGRNALYLAKKDFIVEAIDFSRIGVEKIIKNSKKIGLNINVKVGDLKKVKLHKKYNLVLSTFISQYFNQSEFAAFVKKIQNVTRENGLNMLSFINNKSEFVNSGRKHWYFADVCMILALYKNWQIVELSETTTMIFSKKENKYKRVVATNIIMKKI